MLSFSLIIETENLGIADQDRLWGCLESVQQALSKTHSAEQSILLNSGDLSVAMNAELMHRYPWIKPITVPANESYYQVKMRGVNLVKSDLVIFVDSDCLYNEDWLAGLLEPFADPQVNIVAGETGFAGTGPYVLALSIAHTFDGFSGKTDIYPVNFYYANNVAFRRSLILKTPIQTELPLFRSGCYRHCVTLRLQGETIWMQPRSQAQHAAPEGLSHFFWRFLLFGRDLAVREALGLGDNAPRVKSEQRGMKSFLSRRFGRAIKYHPGQWIWLPIALPIIMLARALIHTGQMVARFKPESFIGHFAAIEGIHYPTITEYLNKSAALTTKCELKADDRQEK